MTSERGGTHEPPQHDTTGLPLAARGQLPSRFAISVLYVVMSLPLGGWLARIPEIRTAVRADDRSWGFANGVAGIGEFVGFLLILVAIGKHSTRRLTVVAAVLALLCAPLTAFAPALQAVTVGLLVWAVANKVLGTTMGALAMEHQKELGRPVIGMFEACYSFGMFAGGGLAYVSIRFGVSPGVQLTVSNLVLATAFLLSLRWLPDEPRSRSADFGLRHRLRARARPQLLLLAGIACLASVIDSIASQWSAVYTSESIGAGESWGAATYTSMIVLKGVALLFVDRLLARFGWQRIFRVSMLASGGAFAICLAVPSLTTALLSFAVLGVGLACVGPVINSLTALQGSVTSGEGRTVLEFGELPGYIVAPLLAGLLAQRFGLGWALVPVVLSLAACFLISFKIREARLAT
jgi:MFS family permease